MKIELIGDVKSLIVDGVEMIKPKTKNLASEFMKHVGAKEYTGIVETIQKWYYGSLVKDAWCATSVSYFAEQCGLSEQIGKHENVDRMKEYMEKRGKIKMSPAYGGDYKPKKGDLVFFSKGNTYKDCTHVGVVSGVKEDNITWVGGNTSDAIATKINNMRYDKYLVCFGVIDY